MLHQMACRNAVQIAARDGDALDIRIPQEACDLLQDLYGQVKEKTHFMSMSCRVLGAEHRACYPRPDKKASGALEAKVLLY